MTTEIAKAREWEDAGLALIGQAEDLDITDQATLDGVTGFLSGVRALQAEIHEFMDPLVKSAYDAHRTATQARARLLEGPATAERLAKDKLVAYERKRRAAQEEADRQHRERLRKAQEEEQARRAAEARAAGEAERAARIETGPPPTVLVAPAPVAPPKPTGVSFREQWTAKVTDLSALVAAVAAGTVPVDYLLPNQAALDAMARSLKDGLRLPGVEAVKDLVAAGGRS